MINSMDSNNLLTYNYLHSLLIMYVTMYLHLQFALYAHDSLTLLNSKMFQCMHIIHWIDNSVIVQMFLVQKPRKENDALKINIDTNDGNTQLSNMKLHTDNDILKDKIGQLNTEVQQLKVSMWLGIIWALHIYIATTIYVKLFEGENFHGSSLKLNM